MQASEKPPTSLAFAFLLRTISLPRPNSACTGAPNSWPSSRSCCRALVSTHEICENASPAGDTSFFVSSASHSSAKLTRRNQRTLSLRLYAGEPASGGEATKGDRRIVRTLGLRPRPGWRPRAASQVERTGPTRRILVLLPHRALPAIARWWRTRIYRLRGRCVVRSAGRGGALRVGLRTPYQHHLCGPAVELGPSPYFVLIERALRDEGTSYHYLPPAEFSCVGVDLLSAMKDAFVDLRVPVERAAVWTTDAPLP